MTKNWNHKQRLIGSIQHSKSGPTVIFIGGLHGNEPMGVRALENVMKQLEMNKSKVLGNIFALRGNLQALIIGERFIKSDLNRIWTNDEIEKIETNFFKPDEADQETREQFDLYQIFKEILDQNSPPYYFIDLHTVSSKSCPFIVINDMLINRELAFKIPVPVILGIEEYVDGTLLNKVNRLGYVALGFESGTHQDPASLSIHESFVWLILKHINCLAADYDINVSFHNEQLKCPLGVHVYDIQHQYKLLKGESFKMKDGYQNFQQVNKGELLAISNNENVYSPGDGNIFMPLYQPKGDDGFFIVRKVPKVALSLSSFLRKVNFEALLRLLPGIKRHPSKKYVLIVDTRTARYFALDFFHLLGYRNRERIGDQLYLTKREYNVKANKRGGILKFK